MHHTIVYLIRHSIPESPVKDGRRLMYGPDAPLSPDGRQKARQLGERILAREGKPLDVIYSSPFKRAYETACILVEKMALNPVITHPGLQDTASEWGGVPVEELVQVANAGRLFTDPRTHESISEIAARITAAYHQIVSHHQGERIGMVSHGDPLRILYDRIVHPDQEIPPYPELVREMSLDVAQSLRLEYFPEGRIEIEMVA
jgi:broad specificity phosphatase PhoE